MATILVRRRAAASLPSLAHRASFQVQESGAIPLSATQLVQLRLFSNAPSPGNSPVNSSTTGTGYTYTGPFSAAVLKVKKLSLFSCACALGAGPVIMGLDAASTFTAKASIAGTLASFGMFTTGLLHWFTSPYVHKLVYAPQSDSMEISMLNVLGRHRTDHVRLADVTESDSVHPLSSFAAGGKIYYVDRDHFMDKKLLERLAPAPAPPSEGQATAAGPGGGSNTNSNTT